MMKLSNCVSGVRVVVHEPDREYEAPSPEVATLLVGVSPEQKLVIFWKILKLTFWVL
jgi:hypothetical protein